MKEIKTAICKVQFDGWDWLNKFEIKSPTGKRIRFEFNIRNQISLGWFKKNYPVLTKKLYSQAIDTRDFYDVEFTYDEMKTLLALSNCTLKEEK